MHLRHIGHQNGLFIIVFLTGAAVLILEITATRLLSPYFGNTIFTVTSVISVILSALSIGYFFGGRLADKKTSLMLFYTIIALSGVTVFLIYLTTLFLIPYVAYMFSIEYGPLISSLLLFLLPNALLGMLSPLVAALQKKEHNQKGTGRITGDVFFWSTLGSIAGSLLCGFVLIPTFGVDTIIVDTGLLLVAIGLFGMILHRSVFQGSQKIILSIAIASCIELILAHSYTPFAAVSSLYRKDGVYEKLTIYDGLSDGKPTRFLTQDRSSSAAMYLNSPGLVYEYTKYFQIYKLINPDIKSALFIGGGAYSMPKALLADDKNVTIDVTEIEPQLYELGKRYFQVPDTPRLTNHVEDGRRFLHDTKNTYNMIFSDVYFSLFSVPSHFTTKEFFALSKSKLKPNGIFAANLIGSLSRASPSFLFSEIKTFQAVFPNSYFFAVNSSHSSLPQNIIIVGINGKKRLDFTTAENDSFLQTLPSKQIDMQRFDLSSYPIFTDNYSPVEYAIANTLVSAFHPAYDNFDGSEALALIRQQLAFGPRYLSSGGHTKEQLFIRHELAALTQQVILQPFMHASADGTKHTLTNIIGRIHPEQKNRIILATHYDSQRFAHNDPSLVSQIVPGADNSASGVAVLLQLAQQFVDTNRSSPVGIDLIFFDGEEGEENLKKSPWEPLGSGYFSTHIKDIYPDIRPTQAVVLDMICDKDLQIFEDKNSLLYAPSHVTKFWKIAAQVSSSFIAKPKYQIYDDHTPLAAAGIPSFLLIDYDYPYYDSPQDTLDKCSEKSLSAVGSAVMKYISN